MSGVMSMKKNKKIPYESPVIIPLGELARGFGANCKNGSAASKCSPGSGVPPPVCSRGTKAGITCNKGSAVGK
jgi:hypothetical protein